MISPRTSPRETFTSFVTWAAYGFVAKAHARFSKKKKKKGITGRNPLEFTRLSTRSPRDCKYKPRRVRFTGFRARAPSYFYDSRPGRLASPRRTFSCRRRRNRAGATIRRAQQRPPRRGQIVKGRQKFSRPGGRNSLCLILTHRFGN